MEKFIFDSKKIEEFEKEKASGFLTDATYYGSYYFSVNLKTGKLNFVYLVGYHSERLDDIDGALNISLDENGNVVCEEVDASTYEKDVSIPACYLIADFNNIIYNPKLLHYAAIANDNEKIVEGFKGILNLIEDRDFKYYFINCADVFMKHNAKIDKLKNQIDALEDKQDEIKRKIYSKKMAIEEAETKMREEIKKLGLNKNDEEEITK